MANERQYAVLGPLPSAQKTRAFLGVEITQGRALRDHPVVVAWLPNEATADPKLVSRLQRETAFVTQLVHPSILRVHGLECFEEGWARVVDYCDGEPLERLIDVGREKSLLCPPHVAARIVADACEGVHYAHEQGLQSIANRPVVHGAIRPDTILLAFDGRTLVTEYGAAAMVGPDSAPKRNAYLAPEQVIGGRSAVSAASDIYGLGAVLYALLCGRPPFEGVEDLDSAILSNEPAKITLDGPGAELVKVAEQALMKRGNQRHASAQAMRAAILAAMGGEPGLAAQVEVATFVNQLIPPDSAERVGRRQLLESGGDLDAMTTLSRPASPPAGVDPALFEASRPPVAERRDSVPQPTPRAALPREEVTQVDGGPPRPTPEREETVPPVRVAPDRGETVPAAGPPAYPDLGGAQLTETTDRIDRRGYGKDPAEDPKPVIRPSWGSPPPTAYPGATGAWGAPAAAAPQAPALPAFAQPGAPGGLHPGPSPSLPPAQPPPAQMPPGMMPPSSLPPGFNPPSSLPPGFNAHGSMPPGMMPPGSFPPGPGAGMIPPPTMPLMPPLPGGQLTPLPSLGQTPAGWPPQLVRPPRTSIPPPNVSMPPGSSFGAAGPMMQPGQMPPGQMLQPGQPSMPPPGPPRGSMPPAGYGTGSMPPAQRGSMPPAGYGTGSMPPAQRGSLPPAGYGTGSMPQMGRTSLPPQAVSTPTIGGRPSMPPQPVSPVPRAPIREVSSVTAFKKDAGDSSKWVLFGAVSVLAIVLIGVFAVPQSPPPELAADEPVRQKLPKELVEAALKGHGDAPELPSTDDPDPPPPSPSVSAAPGTTPAPTAEPSPTVAEAKTGFLSVTTDPPVDVYDGTTLIGRSPFRIELPVGTHKLRFTDRNKLINLYKSYKVRPAGDHKDVLSFGTSQLKVEAPAGAAIQLNGKTLGTAPIEPQTIYEGKYVLKVVHEGKSWSEAFDAPAGRNIDYKVRLEH